MVKVITYGTYDLLHYGHIRLLEHAKQLGDYLIVGITADDYDIARGKINVQQSLTERIEAVRALHIADEIIVEAYEGQKIDDIIRHEVDIFTVGSDWEGKFDYLNEYCKVVYLPRTEGISSSEIRTERQSTKLCLAGDIPLIQKYYTEARYVNGIEVTVVCTSDPALSDYFRSEQVEVVSDFQTALSLADTVYIATHPSLHVLQTREALAAGKHVLCESPIAMSEQECEELFTLAEKNGCILAESIKTAFATAYLRLLLLAKSGIIGKVVSVDATCTSLEEIRTENDHLWNSITYWGPTALMPIFQILGTDYSSYQIVSKMLPGDKNFDLFTKIDFLYSDAVASIRVGKGVKSEGELIISGTEGYIYVPAPWWKTEYFEVRYENAERNRRYFYQLDGEGIRYELVAFARSVDTGRPYPYLTPHFSQNIARVMDAVRTGKHTTILS